MKSKMESEFSRRSLFRGAVMVAGGSALIATGFGAASAQDDKVPQNAAQYQTTPKDKARCDNCVAFLAPSSCKVVAGTISPSGWCMMYSPKS
jgi:hypothetical protein